METTMTVEGPVYAVSETQTIGQKGFRKRELVLCDDPDAQYPSHIPIEFTQDKVSELDDVNVGDTVKVKFELGGREWIKDSSSEPRYFLSAKALQFRIVARDTFHQEAEAGTAAPLPDAEVPF